MAPYLIKSSEAPKKTSGAPSAVTFTQAQTHNNGQTRKAGGCEYDQACRKPAVKGTRPSPVENPPKYLLKDSLRHAEKYLRVSLSYAEPTNWTGDQARGSLALPVDGSPKYLMRDSLTPTERTIWTGDQERGSLALSKEGPPKYMRDSLTHAEKTIWKTGELDQARGARGFHLEDPATKQQREDMARLERELRADELEHARGSRGFHVEDPVTKQQREAWARLERELREDNSQGLNPQAQEFRPCPTPPLSPVQEPMRRHVSICITKVSDLMCCLNNLCSCRHKSHGVTDAPPPKSGTTAPTARLTRRHSLGVRSCPSCTVAAGSVTRPSATA